MNNSNYSYGYRLYLLNDNWWTRRKSKAIILAVMVFYIVLYMLSQKQIKILIIAFK